MSDDECGHIKNDDEPCTYPAKYDDGKCGIHSDENGDTQGREGQLEEYKDDILKYARDGMSIKNCAEIAGVGESTLYEWLEKHDSFAESFRRARAKGAHKLAVHGRVEEGGCNTNMAKFLLERSHGYTKTETHELTGEDGGGIVIDLGD